MPIVRLAHNCCIGTRTVHRAGLGDRGKRPIRVIHWMPMRNLMGHSSGTSGSRYIILRCTLAAQCKRVTLANSANKPPPLLFSDVVTLAAD